MTTIKQILNNVTKYKQFSNEKNLNYKTQIVILDIYNKKKIYIYIRR